MKPNEVVFPGAHGGDKAGSLGGHEALVLSRTLSPHVCFLIGLREGQPPPTSHSALPKRSPPTSAPGPHGGRGPCVPDGAFILRRRPRPRSEHLASGLPTRCSSHARLSPGNRGSTPALEHLALPPTMVPPAGPPSPTQGTEGRARLQPHHLRKN